MTVDSLFRLDGRVALVTGASSGLGRAFAIALANAGAAVVVGARRADRLAETVAEVEAAGGTALAIPLDVSNPDACDAFVSTAMGRFGRVDVLVNNAGVASAIPATQETRTQFESVEAVNLHGSYWMAQACGRVMQPGSSIVNVSSALYMTTAGLPQAAYSASKAGLNGLTRDLAQQWARRKGITVNAVAPGFFASEMTDEYGDGYLDRQLTRVPVGRLGEERELCAAVLFLAAPSGRYVTGQVLAVDGGLTIA